MTLEEYRDWLESLVLDQPKAHLDEFNYGVHYGEQEMIQSALEKLKEVKVNL